MTTDQGLIFLILAATLVLFLWGRWRHDMVAIAALLATVAAGLVPAAEAFAGFGHPAVITVAAVLVLSHGLQTSGAIDLLVQRILPQSSRPVLMLAVLAAVTALLSGFMNNVGALALMMPVALQTARRIGWPPGRLLMPLSFASMLGGMTTLIGTPPNLIASGFRADATGAGFRMFDFTPVGLAVALAGIAFITLVGWRLVPARKRAGVEGFEASAYITEVHVPKGAKAVGMSLAGVEEQLGNADAQVLGLVRNDIRLRAPRLRTEVREDDIIVIEAEPEGVASALAALGMKLEEDVDLTDSRSGTEGDPGTPETEAGEAAAKPARTEENDVVLIEFVVTPGSGLIARSATELDLRSRHGINLLALSRQGRRSIGRLKRTRFEAGDVLLLQGTPEALRGFAAENGLLPLAERPLRLPGARRVGQAVGIFLAAIALAVSGITSAAVAFTAGVLGVMATRVVPPRRTYEAIDWPVIVLLGALLPVADAMEATGAAGLIARLLVDAVATGGAIAVLVVIFVITMTLSDLMNNAATVAVMAPIALGVAATLGANPDAFLMAVAIAASCAFLTPISHQNNTLILGPGGFRFGDYWRLGLPLELIVLTAAVPMIALVWGI